MMHPMQAIMDSVPVDTQPQANPPDPTMIDNGAPVIDEVPPDASRDILQEINELGDREYKMLELTATDHPNWFSPEFLAVVAPEPSEEAHQEPEPEPAPYEEEQPARYSSSDIQGMRASKPPLPWQR